MGPARLGGLGPAAAALLVTVAVAIGVLVMVGMGGGFHHSIETAVVTSPVPAVAHGG